VPKRICRAKTKSKIRRRVESWSTKTKIAALTAIAALICASPAFAQAYSSGYGTGNNQPSYFDKDGALHSGNMPQPQITPHSQAPHNQVAAHRRGLTAIGSVGHAGSES
jgi:hypothetical protein